MSYILLVVGFIFLIKGADFFVDGAVSIANRFKIPPMIIGMTIVAIGTSLPEITISALASFQGNNGMAVGNVIGSDILNTCVVLGVVAVICAVPVAENTIKIDLPFLLVCSVLLLIMGKDGTVGRLDGVVLLVAFLVFTVYMILSAKGNKEEVSESKTLPIWQVTIYLILGVLGIKFGGDFVVDSATEIAQGFGMSDNLIGLTIVAFGTSLPELATSVVVARKKQVDLAVGNVVGSNIFNIVLALMLAALVSQVAFTSENMIDLVVLIGISVVTLVFAITKRKIVRFEGIALLLIYFAYMGYAFIR